MKPVRKALLEDMIAMAMNSYDGIDNRHLSDSLRANPAFTEECLRYLSTGDEEVSNDELDFLHFEARQEDDRLVWYSGHDNPLKDRVYAFLSPFEKHLIGLQAQTQKTSIDRQLGYMTKSFYPLKDRMQDIELIDRCIRERRCLSADYRDKAIRLQPLAIVFYELDHLFYIINNRPSSQRFPRLDRMTNLVMSDESFTPDESYDVKAHLACMWGFQDGQATHVVIQFDNAGNILSKLERELDCRPYKKLTVTEDHILYEDRVIGMNKFRQWLRSFGYAVTVLEPPSLREAMIASARKCLDHYRDLL